MVGTKGGSNTVRNTAWITGQLYSDGRMCWVFDHRKGRYYLSGQEQWDRYHMSRKFGDKLRVRVRAKRQQW